jgi:hypothetical protein
MRICDSDVDWSGSDAPWDEEDVKEFMEKQKWHNGDVWMVVNRKI